MYVFLIEYIYVMYVYMCSLRVLCIYETMKALLYEYTYVYVCIYLYVCMYVRT